MDNVNAAIYIDESVNEHRSTREKIAVRLVKYLMQKGVEFDILSISELTKTIEGMGDIIYDSIEEFCE